MTQWLNRTLAKVEIRSLLGQGAMATVYLGHHLTLNRPVAVKILNSPLAADPSARQRFHAEAQAVAALQHPNLVQVFDFDEADEHPFIVMELVAGASLAAYLQRVPRLPPETVARLVLAVAGALDYAHAQGIVHRDVKPANILLRSIQAAGLNDPLPLEAEAVLSDFGVARLAQVGTLAGTGTISGTPTYLSPEQAKGEPVDGRADVYSLGIVAYELLAGHPPFGGPDETLFSLILKHVTAPPPPLPHASPAVQQVMDKVLAKDPAARYARAGEFALALLTAIFGTGVAPLAASAAPLAGLLETLQRLAEQAQAYARALPPSNYAAQTAVANLKALAQQALTEAQDMAAARPPRAAAVGAPPFSPREFEVLGLVAQGLTNKEIAYRLRLSERTVQFHLNSVFNKTGTNSRTEAVALALRQGWLQQ